MTTQSKSKVSLFNGSFDMQTPVTSLVTPHVTARHLRINPREWVGYIALTFDVSGCQIRKQNDGSSRFKRKPVSLTEEMVSLHTAVTAMSTTLTMKDCAMICRNKTTCMAFTYQTANGVQWCTGYSAWIVVPGRIISDIGVFVNQGRDFRFYLAGEYSSQTWSYNGGKDMINSDIWSSGNPDPGQGHCVMLTQTGLASVDCQQQLFSICDVLLCSDYLVSGFHGVNDTAMTSSSNFRHSMRDNSAYCGRLDYPGDDTLAKPRIGCWVAGKENTKQYIQGRQRIYEQWVKSYYLLHSMDGVTWTTVSSPDGNPKLFNGSFDIQTPVTSLVTPHVTARHLRINPREWEWVIALTFDVSGCQIRKQNDGSSRFERKPVSLTEEMVSLHTAVTAMSTTLTMKDCAMICRNKTTCLSFTYQTANGVQWCTGYSAWIVVPGRIISDTGVFVNQGIIS
ncbi:uncharacterized protein LOC117326612 [Pecten maximus]|uniref:uncharacterized protein LOC117326612 n=1 Tax=Pecten maximus TaxID=6579 RepID=UPI001458F49A|nr:uncharacterized protein LOC117326612 [Pecten maximus]